MATPQNLIVPINLQALYVSENYAKGEKFVRPEADFSALPYKSGEQEKNEANISEKILRSPDFTNTHQLPQGMHLHWALPDALTHSKEGADNFPLVPNRWLVTRIQHPDTDSPVMHSWVVESDYLVDTKDQENLPDMEHHTTVPHNYDNSHTEQPYRYMGRKVAAETWKEDDAAERFPQLTAIGYGSLTFASFYPNCSTVFGFHDDLTDVEDAEDAKLSYVVTGWYSDTTQDFFQKEYAAQDTDKNPCLDEDLCPDKDKDPCCEFLKTETWCLHNCQEVSGDLDPSTSRSLYSGLVKNIMPGASSVKEDKTEPKVVFAPSNIEALSALIANNDQDATRDQKKQEEQLLNALQLGMLKDLDRPTVAAKLAETLNARRFQHSQGGTIYTVTQQSSQPGTPATGTPSAAKNLPKEVAATLNELNTTQQNCDQLKNAIDTLRWQIFVDWHKYMKAMYDDDTKAPDPIRDFINAEIGPKSNKNLTSLDDLLTTSKKDRDTQKTTLEKQLSDLNAESSYQKHGISFELKATGAPRYYFPADPVLLLANEKETDWSYAGERNKTASGLLRCRVTSQLQTAGTPPAVAVPTALAFAQDFPKLIQEACLLSQSNPGTLSGVAPETIAVQTWQDNPFLPLNLQWQISYRPLLRDNGKNYQSDHITKKLQLDGDDDFSYKDEPSFYNEKVESYYGTILLTPSARSNLFSKLQEELKHIADESLQEDLEDCLQQTKGLAVLSQGLSGFQQDLLMRKQTLQLKVMDPFAEFEDRDFIDQVREAVGDYNITAPQLDADVTFNPIQDGKATIGDLRLIDAFGQYQHINVHHTIYPSNATTYPSNPGTSDWVKLPTRLNQPSRLNFRFLAAQDEQQEMNSHPASSPICGWVMHNKLDHSLMFYDQDGTPIGSLRQGAVCSEKDATIIWESAPGIYPYGTVLKDCFTNKNAELKAFAAATQTNGLAYFQRLLATIDETAGYAAPQAYASSVGNPILVGRPLALVKASLRLELQGLPAANEGWDEFLDDIKNTNNPLKRTNNDFTQVQFPIQLGDHAHFEDGVMGYFTAPKDGKTIEYGTFHATIPKPEQDDHIVTGDAVQLQPYSILDKDSAASTPTLGQNVAMLVDPRASLHAITGILPVKAIKIPEDQYVAALKSIYVTFLTTPVLSDAHQDGQINVPISAAHGQEWSWVEQIGTEKTAEWQKKRILTGPQKAIFKNPQQAYEGWLKLAKQQESTQDGT